MFEGFRAFVILMLKRFSFFFFFFYKIGIGNMFESFLGNAITIFRKRDTSHLLFDSLREHAYLNI